MSRTKGFHPDKWRSSTEVGLGIVGRDVVVENHKKEDCDTQHVGENSQLYVGDHLEKFNKRLNIE